MLSTDVRRMFSVVTAVALVPVFWNDPSWARLPEPVCPTCSIKTAEYLVPWGLSDYEFLRVCLVGLVTRPRSPAITWEMGFLGPDGVTRLTKQVQVSEQGFRCLDTTTEELRLSGLTPELGTRLQFGLRIKAQNAVRLPPGRQPEEIRMDGTVWHSVESIDERTLAATSSHRIGSRGFGFVTFADGFAGVP